MKYLGDFLIFALLLIANGRVFFIKLTHQDPIVILSPLAVILSIFQIFSWGFDSFTGFALLMSIVVLLSNFHAMYRYSEHLYIDHYSPLMKFWAISTCLVCSVCLITIIIFKPVKTDLSKLNVSVTTQRYTGSFRAGFEPAKPFESTKAVVYNYEGKKTDDSKANPIVIFFSDKRADTYHYNPLLVQLASQGYSVFSGDFYSKDCRWLHSFCDTKILRRFGMVISSLSSPYKFNSQKEFYTFNSSLECEAMFNFVKNSKAYDENTKIVLISDFMANTAISDFEKNHKDIIAGTINIDTYGQYRTPGYGLITETDPFLARILKEKKDSKKTFSKLMVDQTVNIINSFNLTNQEVQNDSDSAE